MLSYTWSPMSIQPRVANQAPSSHTIIGSKFSRWASSDGAPGSWTGKLANSHNSDRATGAATWRGPVERTCRMAAQPPAPSGASVSATWCLRMRRSSSASQKPSPTNPSTVVVGGGDCWYAACLSSSKEVSAYGSMAVIECNRQCPAVKASSASFGMYSTLSKAGEAPCAPLVWPGPVPTAFSGGEAPAALSGVHCLQSGCAPR
eukprot:jgi/Chrpa1/3777/Chrysochromulina_OHIO_Genome00010934-RA